MNPQSRKLIVIVLFFQKAIQHRLYSTLAHRGYFPVEDLKTLRHLGSYLQGHPEYETHPRS